MSAAELSRRDDPVLGDEAAARARDAAGREPPGSRDGDSELLELRRHAADVVATTINNARTALLLLLHRHDHRAIGDDDDNDHDVVVVKRLSTEVRAARRSKCTFFS